MALTIEEGYWVLTSDKLKNDLKTFIVDELSVMQVYGFSSPIIQDTGWTTTLDWLGDSIALEIEVGWRDLDAFSLIVRLENGKLPNGYYVSAGKPCRLHLQKVITDRKWHVDNDALAAISPGNKRGVQPRASSMDDLKERFQAYKRVILGCLAQLVKDKEHIFS